MWVTKLLISPVKKRIFCPKTTKFSPKLAFLSIAGSFGALLVGWLVVVARAVSRKTPIYFIDINIQLSSLHCCDNKHRWRGHPDSGPQCPLMIHCQKHTRSKMFLLLLSFFFLPKLLWNTVKYIVEAFV